MKYIEFMMAPASRQYLIYSMLAYFHAPTYSQITRFNPAIFKQHADALKMIPRTKNIARRQQFPIHRSLTDHALNVPGKIVGILPYATSNVPSFNGASSINSNRMTRPGTAKTSSLSSIFQPVHAQEFSKSSTMSSPSAVHMSQTELSALAQELLKQYQSSVQPVPYSPVNISPLPVGYPGTPGWFEGACLQPKPNTTTENPKPISSSSVNIDILAQLIAGVVQNRNTPFSPFGDLFNPNPDPYNYGTPELSANVGHGLGYSYGSLGGSSPLSQPPLGLSRAVTGAIKSLDAPVSLTNSRRRNGNIKKLDPLSILAQTTGGWGELRSLNANTQRSAVQKKRVPGIKRLDPNSALALNQPPDLGGFNFLSSHDGFGARSHNDGGLSRLSRGVIRLPYPHQLLSYTDSPYVNTKPLSPRKFGQTRTESRNYDKFRIKQTNQHLFGAFDYNHIRSSGSKIKNPTISIAVKSPHRVSRHLQEANKPVKSQLKLKTAQMILPKNNQFVMKNILNSNPANFQKYEVTNPEKTSGLKCDCLQNKHPSLDIAYSLKKNSFKKQRAQLNPTASPNQAPAVTPFSVGYQRSRHQHSKAYRKSKTVGDKNSQTFLSYRIPVERENIARLQYKIKGTSRSTNERIILNEDSRKKPNGNVNNIGSQLLKSVGRSQRYKRASFIHKSRSEQSAHAMISFVSLMDDGRRFAQKNNSYSPERKPQEISKKNERDYFIIYLNESFTRSKEKLKFQPKSVAKFLIRLLSPKSLIVLRKRLNEMNIKNLSYIQKTLSRRLKRQVAGRIASHLTRITEPCVCLPFHELDREFRRETKLECHDKNMGCGCKFI